MEATYIKDGRQTKIKRRPIRHVVGIVIGVVLILIAIPVIVISTSLLAQSFISPDQVPNFMGWKPFIVLSPSMQPTIYEGDLAITQMTDPNTLQVGDIIAYKQGTSVITHRIVRIDNVAGQKLFITKGDSNPAEDSLAVTASQVESVYRFRVPGLGSIAMFLQTPAGIVCFVICPLLIFIIYDIIWRKRSRKREMEFTKQMEAEIQQLRSGKQNKLVQENTYASMNVQSMSTPVVPSKEQDTSFDSEFVENEPVDNGQEIQNAYPKQAVAQNNVKKISSDEKAKQMLKELEQLNKQRETLEKKLNDMTTTDKQER